MSSAHADTLPQEVSSLIRNFKSIPGVKEAFADHHKFSKEDIKKLEDIYFAGVFADLPIAMLKRTNGTLDKETIVIVEFTIENNAKGLKALEFLSWWVRDLSRGGENAQIRSIGLPPIADKNIQLGTTLKFWFEAYIITDQEDMKLVIEQIGGLSKSLDQSVSLYSEAFKK